MASDENLKTVFLSAHENTTAREKIEFYNSWAENYDEEVAALKYRGPSVATNSIVSHFSGDREAAVVLDVACGTGLVAKQMKEHGFRHFVGIDGSEAMLKLAKESGLYQDLKQSMLGEEPLPVQWANSFDLVMIVGGLGSGHIPVCAVRDLCKSAKPGGYICLSSRGDHRNVEFKAALESELRKMVEEGLWTCVQVTEVKNWERDLSGDEESGYIPADVYLYKKA